MKAAPIITVIDPAAIARPIRAGDRPSVRERNTTFTADAMANEKLLSALASAVARSTRERNTNARPSAISVRMRRGPPVAGTGASSRARMPIRHSADTANVPACARRTEAAPISETRTPPNAGPATWPEARTNSSEELPASTRSRPITDGR